MAHFSKVWEDSGFLAATPPFLVIPQDGIGLVYLIGVKWLDVRRDLKFDQTNLSVKMINSTDVSQYLMRYSQNFPSNTLSDVLALATPIRTSMHFGSVLLSIEGTLSGNTAHLDCVRKGSLAKMDVYPAARQTVAISFRFIRYKNEAGEMKSGTTLAPPYAKELIAILNRLYLPSANTELTLKSSEFATVNEKLGDTITRNVFLQRIAPLRDRTANLTVFFVGQYKGTDDPLGEAFSDLACLVVDDSPRQYIAPVSKEDEIKYAFHPLDRPKSDRDLHIVLAHEIAHVLGAGHNDEQDNIMSNKRQDLKFDKGTVRAINNG